jgi:hypothetical protein
MGVDLGRKPWTGVVGLWATAAVLTAILCAANLVLGDLNQDEGWYLYAASLVREGQRPYLDFYFPQGPVLPYVYAALRPLWAWGGVAGGRMVTAALGLLSVGLTAALAGRLAPRAGRQTAAFAGVVLVGLNVYQSYFTTIVKLYALTAVFVCAGFWVLSRAGGRRGRWAAAGGAVLLALATGTRFSLLAAFPVAIAYLWWVRRRLAQTGVWLVFGVGGAVAGLAIFGPWLWLGAQEFLFNVALHPARSVGDTSTAILYKAGFVSRTGRAYFFAMVVGVAVAMAHWVLRAVASSAAEGDGNDEKKRLADSPSPPGFGWMVGAAFGAVTVLHAAAPVPYDDYQTPIFPLFAAFVGGGLAATLARAERALTAAGHAAAAARLCRGAMGLLLIGGGLSAFTSSMNQDWFIHGRDRIWWLKKARPQVLQLRDVAADIRRQMPAGNALLLTQDIYLAVQAGLRVPNELVMGPFCYFPAVTTEEARRFRVLNRERLENLLRTTDAGFAALSGYGLGIQMPGVTPMPAETREAFRAILAERFERVGEVPHFGQAHTTLELWRRKR